MFSKRIGSFLANIIALIVSFLIAYTSRFGWDPNEQAFNNINDAMVLSLLLLSYLIVCVFYRPKYKTNRRGVVKIIKDSIITVGLMAAAFSNIVYTTHISHSIPRSFFGYFFAIDFTLTLVCSLIIHIVQRHYIKTHKRKTVVFTDIDDLEGVAKNLLNSGCDDFEIIGIVKLSKGGKEVFNDVKIRYAKAKKSRAMKAGLIAFDPDSLVYKFTEKQDVDVTTYLKRNQVDLVIISVDSVERKKIREIIDISGEMGIDSMITMDSFAIDEFDSRLEDFGTQQVIRFAPRIFSELGLFIKRVIDILGAIVGCLICIVIGIFIAPLIFIADPGPIIFKQKRVGKNGKFFYIFKFRSMYKDAEKRLKDLQSKNEMDGLMFKMKDDPRITWIGKFIRKTSLDEFPQFFNVLFGDMSLVGTRPPTVEEYNQYSSHHKRRLTLKPGITGLWQVSGRSDITDFEEIVKLDCHYIDHWSIWYDFKILLMTVVVVITGKGSE